MTFGMRKIREICMNNSDALHLQLVRAVRAKSLTMRIIGETGTAIKKNLKKFLRQQGHDTLASYLADKDVNIPRSTFDGSVRLWKRYGPQGMRITEDQWINIGPRKLEIISTVVDGDKEWLDKAEHLSVSDLIREVRGGEQIRAGHGDSDPDVNSLKPHPPLSPAKYKKLVKESPCCVCKREGSDNVQIQSHHFPQTRKRTDADWKAIPLCNLCHTEEQHNPLAFWNNYKANIMGWFYRLIVK